MKLLLWFALMDGLGKLHHALHRAILAFNDIAASDRMRFEDGEIIDPHHSTSERKTTWSHSPSYKL